ncbi:hypothetical protein [Streptomyces sp. NPDC058092]|uniref:hypothetical protein n=1 Tax=Streptomyces sp. NPDC058092 TaxID=3346336 RepID=UPI0036E49E30
MRGWSREHRLPAFAALYDRVGRKPVVITGPIASALAAYPLLWLVDSGSVGRLAVAHLVGNPLLQASMYGPMAAFISEMLGTRARCTGASLGYQPATTLGAGPAPLIATGLLSAAGGGTNTGTVSLFLARVCVISAVAISPTRESHRNDLSALEPATAAKRAPSAV